MTAATSASESQARTEPGLGSRRAHRLVRLVAGFMACLYLVLVALLTIWLVLGMAATGWRPVVITGGSMQPALWVGDVILIDEHAEEMVGQRTVITYRDRLNQGLVTHRVHEVQLDSRTYVTKGDANPTIDSDPVPVEAVVGVGRLAVPLIGLPAVWIEQRSIVALSALAIVSAAAMAVVISGLRTVKRAPVANRHRSSELADLAIRRLRLLAAVLIVADQYFDRTSVDAEAWGPGRTLLVGVSVCALVAVNLLSSRVGPRFGLPSETVTRFELIADTAIAVSLVAFYGGSGLGWAVITLPILEATIRHRLPRALAHWASMALVALTIRLFVLDRSGSAVDATVAEMDRLLDQFGVLLLVMIPGAYLTEQLVSDVVRQNRATEDAAARARSLEQVAVTGRRLNELGAELFASLTTAVGELGFDRCDVIMRGADGQWQELSSIGLAMPKPGQAASGLRPQDLEIPQVVVDADDDEESEVTALAEGDLFRLIRLDLSTDADLHVVLRAASEPGGDPGASAVDALRLLAGQATVALQNQQVMTDLRETHDALAHQAGHDALTGLPNRAMFMSDVERAIAKPAGSDRLLSAMFLDLNGFKAVNDTLGHDIGDELLINVARRLVAAVGDRGLVARLGGDEFTVRLDPVAVEGDALAVAGQLHQALTEPFRLGEQTVTVGASIGVAFTPVDPPSVERERGDDAPGAAELVRRADVAMYTAKRSDEEPPIVVYSRDLEAAERRRTRLLTDLKPAIENDELRLVYQPMVSSEGKILAAEALLRWTHAELGAIAPETVLDLAELAGVSVELRRWIIETAVTEMAAIGIDSMTDFALAINLSSAELAAPGLVEVVENALVVNGVPPSSLVLELSVRTVAEGDTGRDQIDRLVELGVGLALDDFGEGQTSLAHLRLLPLRWLKLDLALVHRASTSPGDRMILDTVIDLGRGLGLTTVVEGVETEQQLDIAVAAGADLFQGFGLFRPMGMAQLAEVLSGSGWVTLRSSRRGAD